MTPEDTTEHAPRTRSTRHPVQRHLLPAWLRAWPAPARIAFISVVSVVLVLALVVGTDAAFSLGRIHPGVHVGPFDVGGKTREAAAALIAAGVAERSAAPVTVAAGGSTWEVAASSVALSVDATALAGEAYAVGRGAAGAVISGRLKAIFGGVDVPLDLACDTAALDAVIATVNDAVGTPPVDAGVKVEGTQVSMVEPVTGQGVKAETARPAILAAFVADNRAVTLELEPLEPAIGTAAAQQAFDDAKKMISSPLTLFYGDAQWEVTPATIGSWIDFRPAAGIDPPVLEAFVVSEDVSATVLPMVAQVGRPARDASFQVSNGTVTIVPAEDGLQADAEDLATRLTAVLTGSGERRAELTMHRVEAEITTAEAQQMGIVERISTFTTDYPSSNKPRVNNIHILADALDGTLIPPGGTFSFNETIGPRTAEKGYQEANAIINGKLVPQLGGGICQVGTTVFNAVFLSGLPVVERKNHSLYISHYPTGRDATVSWGGPDFKFKNDTPNWVLVATGYTNSTVTISLYGTSPGYQITSDTGPWTDLKNPPVREVPDPTLPAGSRVIEERGVSGRTIIVVQHVLKDGVEIRTQTFKSVYKPGEEVVRVGTGPAGSTPTTPTP
jgi:vancomycin resistance protein YoaR